MTSDASVRRRLLEELLSGLVAFEHDDRLHGRDPTRGSGEEMRRRHYACVFVRHFSSLARSHSIELEGEMNGAKDDSRMRQLQQGSPRESRSGDASELHGRTARLEAGRSLRRLRGRNAGPGSCAARPAAEVGRRLGITAPARPRARHEPIARSLRRAYEGAPEAGTTMDRWVSRSSSGRRTPARSRCSWSAISTCSSAIRGSSSRTASTSIASSVT